MHFTKGVTGIGASKIGLPFSAIWEMGETKTPFNVKVEKGCCLPFYWNHPVAATRISTRLGFPSLIIGIVSMLLSICSFFRNNIVKIYNHQQGQSRESGRSKADRRGLVSSAARWATSHYFAWRIEPSLLRAAVSGRIQLQRQLLVFYGEQ